MATCVNMGMRLEDKANVSVLIGPASLGFPNTSSWRDASKSLIMGITMSIHPRARSPRLLYRMIKARFKKITNNDSCYYYFYHQQLPY